MGLAPSSSPHANLSSQPRPAAPPVDAGHPALQRQKSTLQKQRTTCPAWTQACWLGATDGGRTKSPRNLSSEIAMSLQLFRTSPRVQSEHRAVGARRTSPECPGGTPFRWRARQSHPDSGPGLGTQRQSPPPPAALCPGPQGSCTGPWGTFQKGSQPRSGFPHGAKPKSPFLAEVCL